MSRHLAKQIAKALGVHDTAAVRELDQALTSYVRQTGQAATMPLSGPAVVAAYESEMALSFAWQAAGGTVNAVCGEEVDYDAINALDGSTSTMWDHTQDHVHEIIIDLGEVKWIDGMRCTPADPTAVKQLLRNCDVFIAKTVALLEAPDAQAGSLIEFDYTASGHILYLREGRYVRLRIGSTDNSSNYLRLRNIELHIGT